MTRLKAALGSLTFFVAAPGVVCGFIPWLITRWRIEDAHHLLWPRILGAPFIAIGLGFLARSFVRFVFDGHGTPAPIAAPERLVVSGAYRHVRNPMYLAVLAINLGQAALFLSAAQASWSVVVLLANVAFVAFVEEPDLRGRFGTDYERYKALVPGWIPRLRGRNFDPIHNEHRQESVMTNQPEFDGKCAFSVAAGVPMKGNAKYSLTIDGETYLFHDPVARLLFRKFRGAAGRAQANWHTRRSHRHK